MSETDFPTGSSSSQIAGLPVSGSHAPGDVLEVNGTNDGIVFAAKAAPGLHASTHELGGADQLALDGSQIAAGTVSVARLPTAIPATSIGGGTVGNTAFGYVANLSSDAQGQLNGKLSTTGDASGLTNIPGAQVTGDVPLAAIATALAAAPGLHVTVDVQRFATPGTFTLTFPAGAVWCDFQVICAASGGGPGRRGTNPAGGGGAGASGGSFRFGRPRSLFGLTETLVLGDGGAGGPAVTTDNTTGSAGSQGGDSTLTINGATGYLFPGAGKGAVATQLGGQPGSTSGGGPGVFASTQSNGLNGASGSTSTPSALGISTGYAPGGGGPGGAGAGYNGSAHDGGQGGISSIANQSFTNGGTAGGSVNGANGTSVDLYTPGSGGGGGASTGDGVTPAGKGGDGIQGSGGGGGGAALNGANSGAGGKGGAAVFVMTCICIN